MTPGQALFAYVGAFVDELARSGVRHACVAPGSRSAPLAILLARHPAIRVWMHPDERSAAFFALGLARGTGRPVALLCTSGTAAANFYPAVVEAQAAGVPLVVLTADRPPESRDVGAPQTIDQTRLFGVHAKWFAEVALPEASVEMLRYVRTLACRAVATAIAVPAGPVHLNVPFREPLVPEPLEPRVAAGGDADDAWHGRADGAPYIRINGGLRVPDEHVVRELADALRVARRPLIVCGPQSDTALPPLIAALAAVICAPLLVDPLSLTRCGSHDRSLVIDAYDSFLRDRALGAELTPDLVLRIGAVPTSKVLLNFLVRHAGVRQIALGDSGWSDPTLVTADVVRAASGAICSALLQQLRTFADTDAAAPGDRDVSWLARWRAADAAAREALVAGVAKLNEPFEGAAFAELAALLPDRSTLVVSSSMPVRDLDAFVATNGREVCFLANRGANGIDGVVSTALGVAAAGRGPTVLAIGDLAFYHDMNGLLAARAHSLSLTILLINNDGGGIFSFLPQAEQAEHFETLFGTPHGLDFSAAATLYGADFTRAATMREVRTALGRGIAGSGLTIVELRTDRARNAAIHRELWSAASAAAAAALGRES